MLAGPEGKNVVGGGGDVQGGGGFRAWGLLAEAGLHTSAKNNAQFGARVGLGVGRLVRVQQTAADETSALEGDVGPMFSGSLLLRFKLTPPVRLGLELGALVFTRVHTTSTEFLRREVVEGGPVEAAGQFLITIGWSG